MSWPTINEEKRQGEQEITDEQYIEKAKDKYSRLAYEGGFSDKDISICEAYRPAVVRGDGGAFVKAWVWVSDEEFE